MFKHKTVFIVGAGASYEYNLPIGNTLKGIIAGKLNIKLEHGRSVISGDKYLADAMDVMAQKDGASSRFSAYLDAGHTISKAMVNAASIDNYLHFHSGDETIVKVGKLAIAASILQAEQDSTLYQSSSDPQIDFNRTASGWLNPLCRMIIEGVQKADIESIFDNIKIITFNYDRCIEHLMSQWLVNYMRIELSEARELMKKLVVIHPYGRIGHLPWQATRDGVPFGADPERHFLLHTMAQIRTFTERVDDTDMLSEMRGYISEAQQVVYLGFVCPNEHGPSSARFHWPSQKRLWHRV